MLTICRTFSFAYAHILPEHVGKCKQLHGHNARMDVEVTGPIHNDGMMVDFGVLKRIVEDRVLHKYDHKTILLDGPQGRALAAEMVDSVVLLPYPPTAENMVRDIAALLQLGMYQQDPQLALARLRLYETDTCYAEWRA